MTQIFYLVINGFWVMHEPLIYLILVLNSKWSEEFYSGFFFFILMYLYRFWIKDLIGSLALRVIFGGKFGGVSAFKK